MHQIDIIIAKYFIALSVIGAAIVWFRLRNRLRIEFILVAIAAAIISYILAKIGAHLFYDTRPFAAGHFTPYFSHGNDNGFPSDHTLFAGLLAFVCLHYSRRLGYGLLALAVLIGLSRVIAGVHHLIDIVGSLVFTFAGTWLAVRLVAYLERRYAKPPQRRTRVQ